MSKFGLDHIDRSGNLVEIPNGQMVVSHESELDSVNQKNGSSL